MKRSTLILSLLLAAGGACASSIDSLRGGVGVDEEGPEPTLKHQALIQGGVERSYATQPPTIPHRIDHEEISLRVNTCFRCHSEKTYEVRRAPKIGDSHYVARDGEVLPEVSSRRYFCTQCHVPQMDAAPLVENLFQGTQ